MQDDFEPIAESLKETTTETMPTQQFYVVSLNKFLVLFMGSAGLYMTYWFYKQWACYKAAHNGPEWPVLRGVFSVFFVPSLFGKLTALYEKKSGKKSGALKTATNLFIVVAVINFVSSNIPVNDETGVYLALVNLFTTPLFCWFCYQAQWFANYVCDDPTGNSNKDYSSANSLWLGVGIVLWVVYFMYVVFPLLA